MLKEYVYLVQMAALVVAAGLLILNATRDAFAIDSRRTTEPPIGGASLEVWEYRYMSGFAEDARFRLLIVAHLVRWMLTVFAFVIVITFFIAAFLAFLDWISSASTGFCDRTPGKKFYCDLFEMVRKWWHSFSAADAVHNILAGILIMGGSVLVYELALIVYHVTQARRHHRENKV